MGSFYWSRGKIVEAVTGSVTLQAGTEFAHVNTDGGAYTVTLPTAAVVAGKEFEIKDEDGNAQNNNITVATQGSETIDGNETATIAEAYGSLKVTCDGTNWLVS